MPMELLTIAAILIGPIMAVLITLWHQSRKEKRSTKLGLFITLMAYRKSTKPTHDWAKALNLIDIVFAENQDVVVLWHQYYEHLCTDASTQATQHTYLDLLSVMAKNLGYKGLQQTDIDKFYRPRVHEQDAEQNQELFDQLLRVLKNTESICLVPKPENQIVNAPKQLPENQVK